jgi:aspartate aminotransferase
MNNKSGVSKRVLISLKNSSFIRAMFEEGIALKKKYGEENVFDFSLGNPENEPPFKVRELIKMYAAQEDRGLHKYMPNAGYSDVREKTAAYVSKETGVEFPASNIVMTCGAAGGINVALKAILDPGDEVVVLAPYFPEYFAYIANHGGTSVVVPPNPPIFQPDVDALKVQINSKTKAVIINTPNNPTGVVYSKETLQKIAEVLCEKEKEFGTTIYIISDEPYKKIVYIDQPLTSIPQIYKDTIIINSYSKSLSLAGERIGYVAVSPLIEDVDILMQAVIYCNRVLGYVNAPSMFQKVAADAQDESVDVESYKKRRDLFCSMLKEIGFELTTPEGAFYLFPKSLIPDDVEFKNIALKHKVIIVPGSGFGCPGYFRIAYCVDIKTIENAKSAFEAIAKEVLLMN